MVLHHQSSSLADCWDVVGYSPASLSQPAPAPKSQQVSIPQVVPGMTEIRVTSVSAGGLHSLLVTAEGAVFAFGANGRGQLGIGITGKGVGEPGMLPGADAVWRAFHGFNVDVCHFPLLPSLHRHTCHLTTARAGSPIDRPVLITALATHKVKRVSAGALHSLALTTDGRVLSWGSGTAGQLGHGCFSGRPTPMLIDAFERHPITRARAPTDRFGVAPPPAVKPASAPSAAEAGAAGGVATMKRTRTMIGSLGPFLPIIEVAAGHSHTLVSGLHRLAEAVGPSQRSGV